MYDFFLVFNHNTIVWQAEEWKNGAIKQQTYWRGDLSKRSEEQEQGARTRKRWWMSSQSAVETDYSDLYGSYLKRKEHLASDKRATVPSSEWNPASPEPTGMWMWMCRLMYAYRKLRLLRCPLPALLPDGAFIFHRFLDEKLYNGGCRSWRLITESYADFSLAAAPSRSSCFTHEPDILK